MATRTTGRVLQSHAQNKKKFSFFSVEEAIERLTHYYVVGEQCAQRVRQKSRPDQLKEVDKIYQSVLKDFHADPIRNPSRRPKTLEEITLFWKNCNELAAKDPATVPFEECLRIMCAVVYGAQLISSNFEGHPREAEIMNTASDNSMKIMYPKEPANLRRNDVTQTLPDAIRIGDRVLLRDLQTALVNEFTLVDHICSAMMGEYWVYQPEDESAVPIELSHDDFISTFAGFP